MPSTCVYPLSTNIKSLSETNNLCPLSHNSLFSILSPSFSLSFPTTFVKTRFTFMKPRWLVFVSSYFSRCFVISFLHNVSQNCLPLRLGWTAYNFSSPATLSGSLAKQQPPPARSARESHMYRKHAASYSAITFSGVCFSSEAKGIWQKKKYTKGCSIGVGLTKSTTKEN